jgi:hypothetical protein
MITKKNIKLRAIRGNLDVKPVLLRYRLFADNPPSD